MKDIVLPASWPALSATPLPVGSGDPAPDADRSAPRLSLPAERPGCPAPLLQQNEVREEGH